MSDDQSFYEIQLNTPHLVLAVLGGAVVGVAIFWLGVVIGSGRTDPGGSPEWQAAVAGESEADSGEPEPLGFYEAVNEPNAADEGTSHPETAQETATQTPPPTEMAAPEFQPSEPVDDQPAEVVARSPEGLPSPDASLASGWVVQVRSTPEKTAADSLQASLVSAGFPAFVVSADVDGRTYYRVRVGRYGSKSDAETIEAELLVRSDIDTAWVTEG